MESIIAWISSTQANTVIRDVVWIIPLVQTIHILAICVVMSSVLLLNLRLVGLIGGGEPKDVFTRRYLPWVWTALVVLFLSGSILIWGEPGRDLQNPTFWTKMSLIVTAIILTFILEKPILRDAHFWDTGAKRIVSRLLAVAAISCWIWIAVCGRWIAYTY
jgi:hypothetical protein